MSLSSAGFVSISLAFVITIESAIYYQVKSKAKLFEQLKRGEQQQSQLINLLDIVPDSVFICTKSTDSMGPRGLFANKQMNKFFGRDILSHYYQQDSQQKKLQQKPNITKIGENRQKNNQNLLLRKVFASREFGEGDQASN